jgi:hypothetical protein
MSKALSALPLILTAAIAIPAQAQNQGQPATTYQSPPVPYGQNVQNYNYGYGSSGYGNYEFDRSLLSAVNACAYRAARAGLGRIVVNEADRTNYGRFVIRGTTNPYGYYGQGPNSSQPNYNTPYPRYGMSFTCTADGWGRVINWDTQRR